jgi:hypothetical protein
MLAARPLIGHDALVQLHRYWFGFEGSDVAQVARIGCGVTAYDCEDALTLLRSAVGVIPGSSYYQAAHNCRSAC